MFRIIIGVTLAPERHFEYILTREESYLANVSISHLRDLIYMGVGGARGGLEILASP